MTNRAAHNRRRAAPSSSLFRTAAAFAVASWLAAGHTALAQQRPARPGAPPPTAGRPARPAPPQAPELQKARGSEAAQPASAPARLVAPEAYEKLIGARQPMRNTTPPPRGGNGARETHPAVGGAKLTNPVPAGAPRVDTRRPAGDVAAYAGLLELTGANLGGANVRVRHGTTELTVLERHATLLLCALPQGGPAPKTAKLEVSSGVNTVSGWTTLHPSFRLVPEAELVPRAEITSIGAGPLGPDGLPYPGTRYTTEVTYHEVPGNVIDEFACQVFVPEIFQQDYVVTREFGFNTFRVSIPEAELPGWNRVLLDSDFSTSRAGIVDSKRRFYDVQATHAFAEQATYKIDATHALRDVLDFEQDEVFGLTEGTSQGLAGSFSVGQIELGGDLAFRVASAPTGTYAAWVSSLVPLNNGWAVTEMVWSEDIVHPTGTQPIAEVLRRHTGSGFSFDTGQKYVGWETLSAYVGGDDTPLVKFLRYHTGQDFTKTANPSPYDTENRRYVRPLRVALRSKLAVTNDNRATARLVSVTLVGPQGAHWSDAFGEGVAYDMGRWLVGTMVNSYY